MWPMTSVGRDEQTTRVLISVKAVVYIIYIPKYMSYIYMKSRKSKYYSHTRNNVKVYIIYVCVCVCARVYVIYTYMRIKHGIVPDQNKYNIPYGIYITYPAVLYNILYIVRNRYLLTTTSEPWRHAYTIYTSSYRRMSLSCIILYIIQGGCLIAHDTRSACRKFR